RRTRGGTVAAPARKTETPAGRGGPNRRQGFANLHASKPLRDAMIDRNAPTENQDGNVVYPAVFLSDKDGAEQEVEKVCSFKPSPAIATNVIIERGKAALSRLEHDKQTWPDWCAACVGMLEIQTLAMRAAQTNKPNGPQYRQTVKHFLVAHRLDHIHKST